MNPTMTPTTQINHPTMNPTTMTPTPTPTTKPNQTHNSFLPLLHHQRITNPKNWEWI